MAVLEAGNGATHAVSVKTPLKARTRVSDRVANGHFNGVESQSHLNGNTYQSAIPRPSASPYKILEEPSRLGRTIRVITIGAGASALNFAHEIDKSPLDIQLVIYEKNSEIGGTWFENKYPGAACDIPSVNYQLSWAPSAHWSS
jgi:hypothetical protein